MKQTSENGKKPNFGPNFGSFDHPPPTPHPQQKKLWVLPLLIVRNSSKLLPYAIATKSNEPNFRNCKKPYFGPPDFFVGFASASS